MNINLTGKYAIVCGSSQGIGKACAEELASLGANVIITSRHEETLQFVVTGLKTKNGQKHSYVVCNFDHFSEVNEKFSVFLKDHPPINILVNNSGGPAGGQAIDSKPDEYLNAFNRHLLSSHALTQLVVEGMKKSGYGRIINIISTSVKQPIKDLGVSNTVRSAMANWAKTLSFELGHFGITVNNVLPGATNTSRMLEILERISKKTGMTMDKVQHDATLEIPMGRFAEPEDIAYAVAFLASPAAGYINGINLPVDGGRLKTL